MYALFITHMRLDLFLLDFITLIIFIEECRLAINLLILQFPATSCYFLLLTSSSQHPVLRHLQCSTLDVKGEVSHLYKNQKSVVLYILVSAYFDKRLEDRKALKKAARSISQCK
jgi:hypothetical protein